VDILQQILEEGGGGSGSGGGDRLRSFFEAYGAAEAASMAIMIAASRSGSGGVPVVRTLGQC
jgi:hypothetical protein